jgi:hypothetical protein
VTGGQVYRGPSFSELSGKYLFCDYCSSEYWLLWQDAGEWQHFVGTGFQSGIVSFGTDVFGEMFAVKGDPGTVYRVLESSDDLADHITVESGPDGVVLTSPLSGSGFEWFLNGNLIDGENAGTLSVNESGTYSLIIITESGCRIATNSQEVVVSDTRDHSAVQYFEVYPNPSQETIWVDVHINSSAIGIVQLELYSLDGRLIRNNVVINQAGKTELDLANLDAGMYLIQLRDSNGALASRKLILQ